jgi:WXXGXW repeat (2 copies)
MLVKTPHPPFVYRSYRLKAQGIMKKLVWLILVSLVLLGYLNTGCVEHQVVYVPGPPPVTTPPPAPPQEAVVVSPGPEYVWQPGYWSWQGRWVWVRGAWVIRPHAGAVWVPGHWLHRGHGYVWINGYWR